MPEIYMMLKPVSGRCNMRCTYCFYGDELRHRAQGMPECMSAETLERVVQKALEAAEGHCTFAYQGGEPTLAGLDFYRHCIQLQKQYQQAYHKEKVVVENVLQTNGYGLTREWGQFLSAHHFLVGVSVDGLKSLHDAYRRNAEGGDTYLQVLQGIRILEEYGVPYNILTVVHNRTAPKIRRIYEQYAKAGFRYQQYLACLDPIGMPAGAQSYSLTPQTYGRFLTELWELWEADFWQGRQPYIRQFENWVGILLGEQPEACEQQGVCGIQNIVEADGSVYPCDFYALDAYCLGNLNTDTLAEIEQRREAVGFLGNSRNHDKECLQCAYFTLCRGGCRRLRNQQQPEGGWRNDYCEAYKIFFDRCHEGLVRVAEACRRRKV